MRLLHAVREHRKVTIHVPSEIRTQNFCIPQKALLLLLLLLRLLLPLAATATAHYCYHLYNASCTRGLSIGAARNNAGTRHGTVEVAHIPRTLSSSRLESLTNLIALLPRKYRDISPNKSPRSVPNQSAINHNFPQPMSHQELK